MKLAVELQQVLLNLAKADRQAAHPEATSEEEKELQRLTEELERMRGAASAARLSLIHI